MLDAVHHQYPFYYLQLGQVLKVREGRRTLCEDTAALDPTPDKPVNNPYGSKAVVLLSTLANVSVRSSLFSFSSYIRILIITLTSDTDSAKLQVPRIHAFPEFEFTDDLF